MTVISKSEILPKLITASDVAVDTETDGKDVRTQEGICIGISVAIKERDEVFSSYFPLNHTKGNVEDETKKLLFDLLCTKKRIIFHNAKFDLESLETVGLNLKHIKWYCTLLMAHMLNENKPKSLDWLSKNVLGREGKKKSELWEALFKIYGWSRVFPVEVMCEYASVDAEETLLLFYKFYPYFVKSGFDGPL
jgi:ribonuclease D